MYAIINMMNIHARGVLLKIHRSFSRLKEHLEKNVDEDS